MNAGILAVGSELLGTDRVDTNSLRLTEALLAAGCELARKSVVADDHALLVTELRRLIADCDLVLVTGGLGPTRDDLTREALAEATGRPLSRRPELEEMLRDRFARFGRELTPANSKQADLPEGAEALANARGTAPGVRLTVDGTTIFLFPGVPHELQGLLESELEPWLARRGDVATLMSQIELRVAALPESVVEERLDSVYERFGQSAVAVLASPGEVRVRVRAFGPGAQAELDEAEQLVRTAVGGAVYGVGTESRLEATVGELLRSTSRTVVVAESCTGGLVGQRLTAIPGSSAYFLGGILAYSNDVKERELGVSAEALRQHGAVSRPVAVAMAEGVRERFDADHGLGITGVAGPGGGSDAKPVGTVHLAVSSRGGETVHNRSLFPGGRDTVRNVSSQVILEMLRRLLLGQELDAAVTGGRSES
ncbi:MAG: competence/damage-inducible protein A [Acidobacteriota bacterium]